MIRRIKLFLFILSMVTWLCPMTYANDIEGTNTYKDYLFVLVHGINTTHRVFMGNGEKGSDVSKIPNDERYPWGDLKGYLENDLGLKGYVYSYTFSWRDGSIKLEGEELAKSNHDNEAAKYGGRLYHNSVGKEINNEATEIKIDAIGCGNSWFEQARSDFKVNFLKKNGRDPNEDEIPKKYILIAHSLGGLACRSYISSIDYRDDVAEIITIDSQHLGSDGAQALKIINENA